MRKTIDCTARSSTAVGKLLSLSTTSHISGIFDGILAVARRRQLGGEYLTLELKGQANYKVCYEKICI